MSKTLDVRHQQAADTAANWAANNPVLMAGEIGVEQDTGFIKVGDGVRSWNTLGYINTVEIVTWTAADLEGLS